MKEFVTKHPVVSLCMLYTVCRTIENCVLGRRKTGIVESTFDAIEHAEEDIKNGKEKAQDSGEIGFLKR